MLLEILRPSRLTAVVDVGANPIDGEPPYRKMLEQRLCSLVGFEPQAAALARLKARESDLETYLPDAIGDGQPATLYECREPGMTSVLKPNAAALDLFKPFREFGAVIRKSPIKTKRLDDVSEIAALDFLKVDVQGSELAVFRSGRDRLLRAVAIHTEVSFVPLYDGQPGFGEIDLELRGLGFIPHAFADMKLWTIAPMLRLDRKGYNQVLEADVVYVRDFTHPDKMDNEQLKHLALVAHHCYGSIDLAMNCIHHLVARGSLTVDAINSYSTWLQRQGGATRNPVLRF
jgi:FkbM family methyltransferase